MAEGDGTLPASLKYGSEFEFEFFCELCIEDDRTLEAEGFCVDCEEYLCNECSTHHRRSRSARYHTVLGKEEMPKDKRLSSDRASKDIKTKCKLHKGKRIEFYCNDHGALGCSTCVPMEHRNCKNVVNILEVSDDLLGGQEYRQFVQQLGDVEKTAHDIIKQALDNTSDAKRYKTEARGAVNQLRGKMNKLFDTLETDIDIEVATLEKEDIEKIKSVSASCDDILKTTKELLSDIEKLNASRKVCQLYITLKETSTRPRDLQRDLIVVGQMNTVRAYKFEPDCKLKAIFNLPHTIGKIAVSDSADTEVDPAKSNECTSNACLSEITVTRTTVNTTGATTELAEKVMPVVTQQQRRGKKKTLRGETNDSNSTSEPTCEINEGMMQSKYPTFSPYEYPSSSLPSKTDGQQVQRRDKKKTLREKTNDSNSTSEPTSEINEGMTQCKYPTFFPYEYPSFSLPSKEDRQQVYPQSLQASLNSYLHVNPFNTIIKYPDVKKDTKDVQ